MLCTTKQLPEDIGPIRRIGHMKTHGGYRNLKSYQTATIIYDLTVQFCAQYISKFSRTVDQMVQAARTGKSTIAEGSQDSATSKKSELKLIGVSRGSLEELLGDYEDFLRQHALTQWPKDHPKVLEIRALGYKSDRSYKTYKTYLEEPEAFANCAICLIHQANYLLDRQLQALEKAFIENGGYTENLFRRRLKKRKL